MKRLGYRKSRHGCTRCKERRVKCDEGRPCKACKRHGLTCSLEISSPESHCSAATLMESKEPPPKCQDANPVAAYKRPRAPSYPAELGVRPGSTSVLSSLKCSDGYAAAGLDPFQYFASLLADYKPENASNWIADAELMHHYTAVAYSTIAASPDVHRPLQHELPKQGLIYPFLLHQILAFSGFHLAYTRPHNRHVYLMQASQHQNYTIYGMRETLSGTISKENCHAVYATSIMLTLGAFAIYPCYEKYNAFFLPIESLSGIFTLITGMGLILSTSDEVLRKGPLNGMFKKPTESVILDHPCPILSERLPVLKAQLNELDIEEGIEGENIKDCLRTATAALEHCLETIATRSNALAHAALRAAFLWPLLLPAEYLELLKRHDSASLVILVHYALIIHSAEVDCWYLRGWGDAIATSVAQTLAGTAWLELARWPISMIQGS